MATNGLNGINSYDHINRRTIEVTKDPTTRLYLFPDRPQTLKMFKDLQAGKRRNICFHEHPRSSAGTLDPVKEDF
jgi:hypothetical protein